GRSRFVYLMFGIGVTGSAVLWLGDHREIFAQSGPFSLVRVCERGAPECESIVGRSVTLGQAQPGTTVTIPQGCGTLTRVEPLTLSGYSSSIGGRSDVPAINVTAYPRYESPKAGDRITITNDAQHCCVVDEKAVICEFKKGEKVVKVMLGPRG